MNSKHKFRIGIAGFSHESVSFWPGVTDLSFFKEVALHGDDITAKLRNTNTPIGGFIDICEHEHIDLYPICAAQGDATATVADEVYDHYVPHIVERFSKAGDTLDGILLDLHGAMVTESRKDPETDVIREIREAVGYDIPVMVSLDLHANKDDALLRETNGIFGFQSSPHTDAGETGRRAARAMIRTLTGDIKPCMAIARPGIAVPSVFSATTLSPGKDIIDRVHEWEQKQDVIDVTALFGFSWSDVPQLGMSMIAVTDNDPDLAQEITDDLSQLACERRELLTGKASASLYSVEEGVSLALEKAETASKPIIILDHADRTNDTTFVLKELISQGAERAAVPLFYSPKGAATAAEKGAGSRISLTIGGSTGWRDGGALAIEGKVIWAGQGTYTGTGPMRKNLETNLGTTAVVDVNGIWLQLVSRHSSLIDADPIIQFGASLNDFNIIVSKSKTHFRAAYEEAGEMIIIVDAPGQCPADTSLFEYKHIRPGVYPIS